MSTILEETVDLSSDRTPPPESTEPTLTLAALPIGARLVLRCRADWRDATVVGVKLETVTLSVGSPSGRTYRIRRPSDTALVLEGSIPILSDGLCNSWRAGFVRYDARW